MSLRQRNVFRRTVRTHSLQLVFTQSAANVFTHYAQSFNLKCCIVIYKCDSKL